MYRNKQLNRYSFKKIDGINREKIWKRVGQKKTSGLTEDNNCI
jgi:hypothetical protein